MWTDALLAWLPSISGAVCWALAAMASTPGGGAVCALPAVAIPAAESWNPLWFSGLVHPASTRKHYLAGDGDGSLFLGQTKLSREVKACFLVNFLMSEGETLFNVANC